ncbi:MAG: FtsX-like permease family protein [Candidatus Omnitrophota bacterium]
MFWKIAWRNIWAAKRRAILKIALSAFCTVFLVFFLSFMHGQHVKMIKDAVEIYTGYIQITGRDYYDHPDYDHLIYNLKAVKKIIAGYPEIERASERLETFALFSGEEDSVGGMLTGINPVEEQYISRIKKAVKQGEYLDGTAKPFALIGKKLAERLKIRLGDKVTYISQAIDYSMAADNLIIKGIFTTGSQLDAQGIFINKAYMDEVFLTEDIASHYCILPKEKFRETKLKYLVGKLNQQLPSSENTAVSWKVPLKSLVQLVQVDNAFGYFSYGILVVVIFFVIMIFSLISIFQRTREIGILRAVGTKPREVLMILLGEAFFLGMISVIVGGVVGAFLVYYYHIHPIEFNVPQEILEQYQKWGVVDMIFPTVFSYAAILRNCLFVLALNVCAVIYPAVKVSRYKPIEAINYV